MLLALLAAASVFAAPVEFDFRSTSFWMKGYGIPVSYCVHAFVLEEPPPADGTPLPHGCALAAPDSRGFRFTRCSVDADSAQGVRARLAGHPSLLSYEQDCRPVPEYPELGYKLEKLRAEQQAVGLSSAVAPSIAGLLVAQNGTLEAFISVHQEARKPIIEIVHVPRGTPPVAWRAAFESGRHQDPWKVTRVRAGLIGMWHPNRARVFGRRHSPAA